MTVFVEWQISLSFVEYGVAVAGWAWSGNVVFSIHYFGLIKIVN